MKKYVILCISIFVILTFGCKESKTKDSGIIEHDAPDSGIVILSIPDWALGVTLSKKENEPCRYPDSLIALRDFDNFLFQALVENKSIGKYTLTRKYNPCCPCMDGGSTCCQCMEDMYFASPSAMNATVIVTGDVAISATDTNIQPIKKDGLDLFTIPAGVSGRVLTIDGKGIDRPLTFDLNN